MKLYIDQYGTKFWARTRKELKGSPNHIPGKVSIMYADGKDGKTYRTGYVIGQHWLTEYTPTRKAVA